MSQAQPETFIRSWRDGTGSIAPGSAWRSPVSSRVNAASWFSIASRRWSIAAFEAHAPRQPLDVGRGRDVEGRERRLLGRGRLVARLERAGDRTAHERVGEQVLGQPAEGVLALLGEPLAQPVGLGLVAHLAAILQPVGGPI
jgi:hypothetical protein